MKLAYSLGQLSATVITPLLKVPTLARTTPHRRVIQVCRNFKAHCARVRIIFDSKLAARLVIGVSHARKHTSLSKACHTLVLRPKFKRSFPCPMSTVTPEMSPTSVWRSWPFLAPEVSSLMRAGLLTNCTSCVQSKEATLCRKLLSSCTNFVLRCSWGKFWFPSVVLFFDFLDFTDSLCTCGQCFIEGCVLGSRATLCSRSQRKVHVSQVILHQLRPNETVHAWWEERIQCGREPRSARDTPCDATRCPSVAPGGVPAQRMESAVSAIGIDNLWSSSSSEIDAASVVSWQGAHQPWQSRSAWGAGLWVRDGRATITTRAPPLPTLDRPAAGSLPPPPLGGAVIPVTPPVLPPRGVCSAASFVCDDDLVGSCTLFD